MNALLSLVTSIHTQSKLLLDSLTQEKLALDNKSFEELTELAPKKQHIIDQLNSLEQQCAAQCPDKNIDAFIKSSNSSPLKSVWENTQALLKNCKQQNEVNGLLINRHSKINNDILGMLTGNQQQAGQTYNAQGNQTSNNSILNNIEA